MTVTGPAELLATWEAGLAERGAARALLLHRAARPDAAPNALASVPLGERAADLFALRRALFGDRMEITLSCTVPGCGAALECELDAGELAALPDPVLKRFAAAAEDADPGAELTLEIACPECGAATPAELDIAAYLWTELDAWARDLLLDVHLLASAYGWSEPEILALSPLRRRYYLELCADA